jgi:hypothetical protein
VHLQSERREKSALVRFLCFPGRALWVGKIQSGKKGGRKSTGKISFSLDLLAAVRGVEIFESRARSFEKERILDR